MIPSETEPDPLHLTRCMRCGYALDGLTDAGTCPECGLDYDQNIVVLCGEARGNTATAATGSRGAMIRYGAFTAFFLLMGWKEFQSGRGFFSLAIGASLVVTFALMLVWRMAARRSIAGGSLTQCRFNGYGVVQCDTPDETTGITYPRRGILNLVFIAACVVLLLDERDWVVLFIMGAIAILIFIGSGRRVRAANEINLTNEDARRLMISAGKGWREAWAIPWVAIESVSITPIPAKPHRRRLKVFRSKRWKDVPIDAEVECTIEQEAALQLRILDWQKAAR